MKRRTGIGVALLLVGLTGPAFADSQQDAVKLNNDAQKLYLGGEYADAAKKFFAAYELYPEPRIKLGEAMSWYKHGDCDQATRAASLYADKVPDPPKADISDMTMIMAECKVLEGRAAFEAGALDDAVKRADEAAKVDTYDRATESIAALRADIEKQRQALAVAEAEKARKAAEGEEKGEEEVIAEPADPPKSGSGRRTIGWVLGGIGAAAGVGSLAIYAANSGKITDAPDDDVPQSAAGKVCDGCFAGSRALNFGLGVAGGVLGAAGLALIFWPDSEQPVSLSPGPGDVGASFTFEF